MKPWVMLTAGILIGLFAGGIVLLISSQPRGEPIRLPLQPTPIPWMVQVRGAVQQPGVYPVPVNSRVMAAVQAAGGMTDQADSSAVNLAALLNDGQYIFVPEKGQANDLSPTLAAEAISINGPVNINLAAETDLEVLPGIGPQKAAAIIAYRNEHGPFLNIDQIQQVPGIGAGIYARIKNYICVDQP